MPVTDYFGQTAYAGRISELAINEALRDRIVADGGTPVRDGAQLQAQDTFPRLIEQALGLVAGQGKGWAANARAVVGAASLSAATDDGMFVDQDGSDGAAAANLPSAAALRQGWCAVIRKSDNSSGAITLTPNGADTISGPTTINEQFSALFVCRTGATTWATMRLRGDSGLGWASGVRTTIGNDVTVLAADDGAYIDADPVGANRLVNLPGAAGLRAGWNFTIRKDGPIGSPETLTLTPDGADTIDGPTVLYNTFDALFVVRTGATSWASFKVSSEPRNNFDAVADPTVNDDATLGYGRWSRWVNTLTGALFACSDPAAGAAVWVALGVAGALMCFFSGFYGNRMADAFAAVVPGGGYA